VPILRFARERPVSASEDRANVRRALEYRAGRPLCEDEVRRLLDAEWDALMKHWAALGRWLRRLEAADVVGVVPRLRPLGRRARTHSAVTRHRQSVAARAVWARRKASDQRKDSYA
jgi:hypothetical protein